MSQTEQFNKLLRFLESNAGRDKIARTLQFISKFLGWWLVVNGREDLAKRFTNLESSSSMARKLFRLGKSLSYFNNVATSYHEESDLVVKTTSCVGDAALGIWLLFDHVLWAGKLGIYTGDTTKQNRRAYQFWLLAMCMGILKNSYLLHQTQQSAKNTTKTESLNALRQRQFAYLLDLLRNVFDLLIPITSLSTRAAARIPSGVVGLSGTISSLIGFYQVWSKIK